MGAQLGETVTGELLSVVYSSTATVPFDELDLAELLMHSRRKNEARGLTGMLLYRDGQFMQLLEGPRRAVRETLAVIAADPRHTGVWTLDEQPIGERRFGSWAMGYRELSGDDGVPPAWYGSPEAAADASSAAAGSRSDELLTWFRGR